MRGNEMPNWCTTSVVVIGEQKDLIDFVEKACAGYTVPEGDATIAKDNCLSLLPAGPCAVGTLSFGAVADIPDNYAHDWYAYNLDNFGVKWDLGDDVTREFLLEQVKDGHLSFTIETAWGFPSEGLGLWSASAPNLVFECTTTEEADFFAGAVIAYAGTVYSEYFDPHALYDKHLDVDSFDDISNFYDEANVLLLDQIDTALETLKAFVLTTVNPLPYAKQSSVK
jgi:hypothetical protein